MKISMEEVGRILQTAGGARVDENRSVELTDAANDIERVTKIVDALPDTREELVQKLKAQIESGQYHVSGEDIADLIVRRTFADRMR